MTRNMAGSLTLGALALLVPATGSAQTFVDVGVWTPGGGGRVVVGGAPVYGVPVYGAPVYGAPVYGVPVYRRPVYRPVYVAPPVYVVQRSPLPSRSRQAPRLGQEGLCTVWRVRPVPSRSVLRGLRLLRRAALRQKRLSPAPVETGVVASLALDV